jgi:hypothetical protein
MWGGLAGCGQRILAVLGAAVTVGTAVGWLLSPKVRVWVGNHPHDVFAVAIISLLLNCLQAMSGPSIHFHGGDGAQSGLVASAHDRALFGTILGILPSASLTMRWLEDITSMTDVPAMVAQELEQALNGLESDPIEFEDDEAADAYEAFVDRMRDFDDATARFMLRPEGDTYEPSDAWSPGKVCGAERSMDVARRRLRQAYRELLEVCGKQGISVEINVRGT